METFTTHITFVDNGGSHTEKTRASDVNSTLQRLLKGPGAMMGIYKEIRMVDNGDNTVFLWNNENGIVWPKQNKEVKHA